MAFYNLRQEILKSFRYNFHNYRMSEVMQLRLKLHVQQEMLDIRTGFSTGDDSRASAECRRAPEDVGRVICVLRAKDFAWIVKSYGSL